jgi:hypothetical protein
MSQYKMFDVSNLSFSIYCQQQFYPEFFNELPDFTVSHLREH